MLGDAQKNQLNEAKQERVRNRLTGEIGVVIHFHEVYPYKGDVTVNTVGGAQLWGQGDYEVIEDH